MIFLHLGCKNDQVKVEETNSEGLSVDNKKPELKPENFITITGKTDEPRAFRYLDLLDFRNPFGSDRRIENKEIIEDSLLLTIKDFTQPQLLYVIAFRDSSDMPFYTRILLTPGDSIFMKVKNGKIRFSGKKEAHYNFFLEMDDPLRQDWAVYDGNFNKYKEETADAYQKKLKFFKNYVKAHPKVSEEFKTKVGNELKFEYLFNLIAPRDHKNFFGGYTNNWEGITNVVSTNYNPNKEKLFDSQAYFDTIDIQDFKRPDLLNSDYFKRSLIFYIRHYFSNQDYLEYSRRNFLNEKEYIEDHLDGKLKTFAIARLISDYHRKAFGTGKEDIRLLKNLIREYKPQFLKDPSYTTRMKEISDDLQSFNSELSEDMLQAKLLTIEGDTVKFASSLKRVGDRIKLIDFWASWCGPCIQEIKKAGTYKRKLKEEDGVEIIYISVDKNKEEWLQRSSELKDYLAENHNQYLLLNIDNSPLSEALLYRKRNGERYFSIPKYTLLDNKNVIISNNAPRPSDSLMFQKLIDQVNEVR